MNIAKIALIITVSFAFVFSFLLGVLYERTIYSDYDHASLQICQDVLNSDDEYKAINGLYKDRDKIIIWVKDREIQNILRTMDHEFCHALVDYDTCHFTYYHKEETARCTSPDTVFVNEEQYKTNYSNLLSDWVS